MLSTSYYTEWNKSSAYILIQILSFFALSSCQKKEQVNEHAIQEIESIYSIETYEDSSFLGNPITLHTRGHNRIYFFDEGLNKIGEIDIQKKMTVSSFGRYGEAPGEMVSISGIDVQNDTIYVLDAELRRLSKLSSQDGSFLGSEKINHQLYRGRILEVDEDGLFLSVMNEEIDQQVINLRTKKRYGTKRKENFYTNTPLIHDDKLIYKSGKGLYLLSTGQPFLEHINIETDEVITYDLSSLPFMKTQESTIQEKYKKIENNPSTTIILFLDIDISSDNNTAYFLCYNSNHKFVRSNTVIEYDLNKKIQKKEYVLHKQGGGTINSRYSSILVDNGILYASNTTFSSIDVFMLKN